MTLSWLSKGSRECLEFQTMVGILGEEALFLSSFARPQGYACFMEQFSLGTGYGGREGRLDLRQNLQRGLFTPKEGCHGRF